MREELPNQARVNHCLGGEVIKSFRNIEMIYRSKNIPLILSVRLGKITYFILGG